MIKLNSLKRNTLSKYFLLMVIPLLAFTTSCNDGDDDDMEEMEETVETETILEIAQGSDDHQILVAAVSKFDDLVAALSDESAQLTVFAPTDAAFADLLGIVGQDELDDIPESVIRRVLEYHVISGTVAASADLSNRQEVPTLLADESVTVTVGASVQIDGATVTTADLEATNGIVHIVDAVLVPSLEASIVNTVVEPAYFSTDFSILTAAVVKAELLSTLIDAEGEFTVFAPNDDAFAEAGITSLDDYTSAQLADILLYHVLDFEANEAAVAELGTGSAVPALGGNSYLSINANGIFLNGVSQVVATDIEADNGVVHVINQTLVPPTSNIVDIAVAASQATEAEYSQLVAALTAVENDATAPNLITILSDSEASFTVFAPTDAAFQVLYDAAGDQNEDGVNDITDLVIFAGGLEVIANVLQYHVVSGRVFSTDIPNVLDGESSASVPTVFTDAAFTLNSDLTIEGSDTALSVGLDAAAIVGTDILGTNGVIHTIDQVILP